jgi:toxin ParE1/3/4
LRLLEEQDGSAIARRVALALYDGVSSLEQFPRGGRSGRKPGTRELVFSSLPYLAVYRVHDDVIEIDRILHGAQRWPE